MGYTGGFASQPQTRSDDAAAAGPGACPFTAWTDSGPLDTSGCTSPIPCTDPGPPYTMTTLEPCPPGSSGDQVVSWSRTYNAGDAGPGACSYTAWVETGRDISGCAPIAPPPPVMCGMGPMAGLILATDPTCCDFPAISDWVEDYRDDTAAIADVNAQILADPFETSTYYSSYIGYDMDVHEEIVVGNAACASNTQTRTRRNDYLYECLREGGPGTPITKCQVVAY